MAHRDFPDTFPFTAAAYMVASARTHMREPARLRVHPDMLQRDAIGPTGLEFHGVPVHCDPDVWIALETQRRHAPSPERPYWLDGFWAAVNIPAFAA